MVQGECHVGEQLTIHECTASEISSYERAQDLGYLDCPKYDLRAGKHPIADMNEREWAERLVLCNNLHDELVSACKVALQFILSGNETVRIVATLREVIRKAESGEPT